MSWFKQTAQQIATIARRVRIRDIVLAVADNGILRVRNENNSEYRAVDASAYLVNGSAMTFPERYDAKLQDIKTNGTAGGASAVAFTNRDLNTEVSDPNNLVTLNPANGRFILAAGEYILRAKSVMLGNTTSGSGCQNQIYNVTTSTVIATGLTVYIGPTTGGLIEVSARYISNGTDELVIRSYANAARAVNGFGAPASSGEPEKYTEVEIQWIP